MRVAMTLDVKKIENLDFANPIDRSFAVSIFNGGELVKDKPNIAEIHKEKSGYYLKIYMYSFRGWKYYLMASYKLKSYDETTQLF